MKKDIFDFTARKRFRIFLHLNTGRILENFGTASNSADAFDYVLKHRGLRAVDIVNGFITKVEIEEVKEENA